ncbi:MAG: Enoyl-CoA hydratase/carnithine racemase [Chloroflexi bacterium]|jgi:enoyl-CoA hydratase/carnithine racemase|nr:Enoyl-CoA hydratase/carnithine racemase [Chloroflexota bacterium]
MAGKHITNFVPTPNLEDYSKKYAEHLQFERKDGILQVRMHTKGGPVKWSFEMHQALCEAWTDIGHDPKNEVLILTSTDPYWIGEFDEQSFHDAETDPDKNVMFFDSYHDATKIMENFIWDIDIPTIAAINGPGLHWECAMMCDITLCVPDFMLRDDHFGDATVPGDGQALIIQAVCGMKRGSYMMFTVNSVDAKTCLDWGLVNEVLPKEKLLPRAWELAEKIKKQPQMIRRLTHQLTVRPWKLVLMDHLQVQMGHEMYALAMTGGAHHFNEIKSKWNPSEKKK